MTRTKGDLGFRRHFRPEGRGKTACGLLAKRSKYDSADLKYVTCRTCIRTVRAWHRWAKERGL